MIHRLKNRFSLEIFESDEDRQAARNLLILLMTAELVCLVCLVAGLVWQDWNLVITVAVGAALQAAPLYLLYRKKLFASSLLMAFIETVIITISATIGEGTHDYAVMAYPVVVIIAGLTSQRRGFIFASVMVAAAIAWLVIGEAAGLYAPKFIIPASPIDILLMWAIVFVAVLAVYQMTDNLHDSLTRVRRELAEQLRLKEALRERDTTYRLLAENVSEVIWILDLNTQVFRYVSPSVERLRGFSVEQAQHQTLSSALAPASQRYLLGVLPERVQAFQKGQPGFFVDQLEMTCQNGSTVWTETTTSLQQNDSSGRLEVYGVARDISVRRRNEAIVQLRLNLLEYAAMHTFEETLVKMVDDVCAFTHSLVGFYHFVEPGEKALSMQTWSSRTVDEYCHLPAGKQHTDVDQAGVWADCIRTRQPVLHNGFARLLDVKTQPTGHAKIDRELIVPVLREGQVVAIMGLGNKPGDYNDQDVEAAAYFADLVWDVVRRKRVEQALSESEARLRMLGENLAEAGLYVLVHDESGKPQFEYMSKTMENLSGVTAEEVKADANKIYDTILPEYQAKLFELEAASRHNLTRFEMEMRQRHARTGEIRWTLLRSTPMRRDDGSTVWYGVQLDINDSKRNEQALYEAYHQLRMQLVEIQELQNELRNQALHDALTGLYNRRYLDEMLERELARMKREKKSLSFLAMDIDYFKNINDSYGHITGDKYIKAIAELLLANARSSDIACRFGGDEFLLVLPGAGAAEATRRADEIRGKCVEIHMMDGGLMLDHPITLSVGIATFPVHGNQIPELLGKADNALYYSKQSGRNRTTTWLDYFPELPAAE